MDGFEQTTGDWKQFTVAALRREIIDGARLLCHEIAHALVTHSFMFENDPAFNDEKMVETGYSMENYLFGGVLRRDDDAIRLMFWPNEKIWNEYYAGGTTIPLLGPLSGMPSSWEYGVHPDAYECLLTDEFWDGREVREGRFKKMWLRPEQCLALARTVGVPL